MIHKSSHRKGISRSRCQHCKTRVAPASVWFLCLPQAVLHLNHASLCREHISLLFSLHWKPAGGELGELAAPHCRGLVVYGFYLQGCCKNNNRQLGQLCPLPWRCSRFSRGLCGVQSSRYPSICTLRGGADPGGRK